MLVVQAVTYSHVKLATVKHKLAMAIFHAISDEISDEVDVTLGPFLDKIHAELPEDHPAYPAINFMKNASGQLKALAGTGLQISGLLGSLATVMNNELASTVYSIVHTNPHLLPDLSTIMQIGAANLISPQEAYDAAGSLGIPRGWAEQMLMLTRSWPALSEALELYRRGLATRDNVSEWLILNGATPDVAARLIGLAQLPVSAADAALAVLRGNITEAEGRKIAAENGLNTAGFDLLIGNTGEPPGLQQLLEAYRRHIIDKPRLDRGIKQSRYRDEWIPMLEQLRYEPMSVADAVNATVQNQMSADIARRYADENGLQPGDFDILLNTAGEPLSRTEMEQLYNRGIVSREQVIQALRESRLKNKYNNYAFDLHQRIPAEGIIQRMQRYGVIDHARAVELAMQFGYSKQDATDVVASGAGERLLAFKDALVHAVEVMYVEGLVSAAEVTSTVTSLGFTATEAAFIVKSADFRRTSRTVQQGINAIRAKFLNHHITESIASGLIDKMGVPAHERDFLLTNWEVEREGYSRNLTEAQVVKAIRKQLITPENGLARLMAMGYTKVDAELLIAGA